MKYSLRQILWGMETPATITQDPKSQINVVPSMTETCDSNLHPSDGLDWRYISCRGHNFLLQPHNNRARL